MITIKKDGFWYVLFFYSVMSCAIINASEPISKADEHAGDIKQQETPAIQNIDQTQQNNQTSAVRSERKKKVKKKQPSREAQFIGDLLKDAFKLHKNLLTWNSLKIITTTFPFFVGARMIDERLQACFYDETRHKNIRFMSSWCHDVAQTSIAVPMLGLGTQLFFAKTENMYETTRIFLLGIPFLIWAKDLIKKLKFDANLRPWHENFSCQQRAGGGFPSGHMAEAIYTATLYGMRFGPRFAIPLGGLASFIGITFVTCNRHYLSQIIAGAGLGVLYAIAANTLINNTLAQKALAQNISLGVSLTDNGAPAVSIAYHF